MLDACPRVLSSVDEHCQDYERYFTFIQDFSTNAGFNYTRESWTCPNVTVEIEKCPLNMHRYGTDI